MWRVQKNVRWLTLRSLSAPFLPRLSFAGGLKRRALWAVDSAKLAPDMNAMRERYQTERESEMAVSDWEIAS